MGNKIYFLLLFFFIINTTLVLADNNQWTQFQQNYTHSGVIECSVPTNLSVPFWEFNVKKEFNVMPIIHDNTLYCLSAGGNIYALNRSSGKSIWSAQTKIGNLQTSIPAYGDGKLFVAVNDKNNNGYLYAFDAATGNQLWNVSVTDGNFECPITYFDHRIYIGEGLKGGVKDKQYYCYSDDGTLLWKHTTTNTSGFLWNGAVVVGDYLVYPTFEGKLVCLNRINGQLIDNVDLTADLSFSRSDLGRIRTSVSYNEGFIYTTSENSYTSGYIWKVGFNNITGKFIDQGWSVPADFSTSTPVVYNDKLYVGQGEHGFPGKLVCLDTSNGAQLWSYDVSGGVKSSPAVAINNNKLYIFFTEAIPNGSFYCLRDNGTLAWEYNPPLDNSYTLQGASIAPNMVYFATGNGTIYGFKSNTTSNTVNTSGAITTVRHIPSIADIIGNALTISVDITANQDLSALTFDEELPVGFGVSNVRPIDLDGATFKSSTLQWLWSSDMQAGETKHITYRLTLPANVGLVNASFGNAYSHAYKIEKCPVVGDTKFITCNDWNPWNDANSEEGEYITLGELQTAIDCWVNNIPAPVTGAQVSTPRMQALVYYWLKHLKMPIEADCSNVSDWNPWNDANSEQGKLITLSELQEAIDCWMNNIPAPITNAEVTTTRMQAMVYFWVKNLEMNEGEE